MSEPSAGPLFDMLKANERVFVQPRIVPKYPAGEDRKIFLEYLCLYLFFTDGVSVQPRIVPKYPASWEKRLRFIFDSWSICTALHCNALCQNKLLSSICEGQYL